MTPEVIEKLEEAFKYGATDKEACAYVDIAPSTLYKYQEENPEFSERKEELKELPIFTARKSVVDKLARDGKLAFLFLERKRKDEFAQRIENKVDDETIDKILEGFGLLNDGKTKTPKKSPSQE